MKLNVLDYKFMDGTKKIKILKDKIHVNYINHNIYFFFTKITKWKFGIFSIWCNLVL